MYSLIKEEGGRINGNMKSFNYKPSPIPSGGLEVHLLLTFLCPEEWVRNNMKKFINDFYTYDFTGISSDESDIEKDL